MDKPFGPHQYPGAQENPPAHYQAPAQYQGALYPTAVYLQADNSNNSSLAPVASIVAGSIGVLTAWIPIVGVIGWVLGPLAIVFGTLGLKRGQSEHKIISILGIIGGGISLVICLGYVVMVASLTTGIDA
jgi:hypothetical protein